MTESRRSPAAQIEVSDRSRGLDTLAEPDYAISFELPVERLEVRSRLMTAHNLVEVRDGRVLLTTFVRYEHPAARPLWSAAALVHRLSVPRLLNHALMNT